MRENELHEFLDEYEDSRTQYKLIKLLKDRLISELESFEVSSEKRKHDLNMVIRDIEEELDWIEGDKLSEFDPEHQ